MTVFWLLTLAASIALGVTSLGFISVAITERHFREALLFAACLCAMSWTFYMAYSHLYTQYAEQHPAAIIAPPAVSGKVIT